MPLRLALANALRGYALLDPTPEPGSPALAAWQAAADSATGQGLALASPEPAEQIQILGRDVKVHLGDSDLQPPWWPLYGGRKPSLD